MRHVVIPVHDERVTHLTAQGLVRDEEGTWVRDGAYWEVPVPQDDQLARAVDAVTNFIYEASAEAMENGGDESVEAADFLRAAFNLEDE